MWTELKLQNYSEHLCSNFSDNVHVAWTGIPVCVNSPWNTLIQNYAT